VKISGPGTLRGRGAVRLPGAGEKVNAAAKEMFCLAQEPQNANNVYELKIRFAQNLAKFDKMLPK